MKKKILKKRTPPKFAIIVSQFNEEVTHGLLEGAKSFLKQKGCVPPPQDIFYVPGAFEIPLVAKKLAESKRFDGVICLGCVIKGETAHFEFISLGATVGLMQSMLKTEVPLTFGVLTTYTDDQAIARSKPDAHNKGIEAAKACFETAELLERI